MNNTKISVIIPVFNGEQYLAETIQSIFDQKYPSLEIIVVDDGSTDGTHEVVKSFGDKLRYYKKENGGPASARNKGLELANGEFIAFIDADDLWTNTKLSRQLDIFKSKPRTDIVIGYTQVLTVAREETQSHPDKLKKAFLLYSLGSTLIRRTVFDKVGTFDEEMLLSEDTDWFFRIMESGISIELHNDVVQFYRYHQNNITNNKQRNHLYQIRAYKKSLDRRRKSGKSVVSGFVKPNNLDEMIKDWEATNTKNKQ